MQRNKKRVSGLQIIIKIFVVLMLLLSLSGILITLIQVIAK
ncbi:DUF4044 domain-containing protein [Weissella muntiaci]|uniref:DUF4044 domain-containing protein n=1 Tax=Weissella muntiaci TaxID=2508881 RepID=A0A6C2C399_9LACO|nr:DUF4044 domain-containing protein [Weissella muntiaci]TYC48354.1 DUF4044 domain-containing protein [Weissella muntiaci]